MTVPPSALGLYWLDPWRGGRPLGVFGVSRAARWAARVCSPETRGYAGSPENPDRPPHTDVTDEYGCRRSPGGDPQTTTESDMPRARKESGLYYVTRDGREFNLGSGSGSLLGGLERDLLFAHLTYAFRTVSQALRATAGATVVSGQATVEQPLPLDVSGDPDAIPANRIKD